MNSPVRFTGLTSGMDTQNMVQQLMRAESMRMDRLTRRRQVLQWRQETIRGSMTRMNEFRSERTNFIGEGSINNESTWRDLNRASVASANGGNTNGITVRAHYSDSFQGSFDVQVRQVAQGDMALGSALSLNENGTINLNQRVDFFVVGQGNAGAADVGVPRNISINGTSIRFYDSDTISEFMDRVNRSNANVEMSFDTMRNRFIMEARGTGANATISTGSDDLGLLSAMGLANIRPGAANLGSVTGAAATLRPALPAARIGDFPDLAGVSSITIGGHNIAVDQNETFTEFLTRVNTDYLSADGMTLTIANGRFTLAGADASSSISVGDGNANALLEFMFGAGYDNFSIQNRAYTTGATMSLASGFDPDDFNFTGPATFVVGTEEITINSATDFDDFLAQLNANTQGMEFALNADGTALTMRSTNPNESLPTFGLLTSLDPTDYTPAEVDAREANIENARDALSAIFGGQTAEMQIQMAIAESNFLPALHQYQPTPPSALADTTTATTPISITVNGSTHQIATAGRTYQQIMDDINAINGVEMTFNASSGAFRFAATGDVAQANFVATNMEFLGFDSDLELANYAGDRLVRQAQNAIVYYGHGNPLGAVRMEQASNDFRVRGLAITISDAVQTATRGDDGIYTGGVFTITNERNIDAAVEMIQEFIDAYNTLLRYVNAQHTTARPRAGGRATGALFEPLTDEQRAAMSEREIERWEEQARIGLLHRDSDMRNLHQQLRRAMFEPIDLGGGRSIALHEIGITTIGRDGAPGDQMIGLLQIDPNGGMERLRTALEGRPEDVEALFSRSPVQATNAHGLNSSTVSNAFPGGTMSERGNRFDVVGLGFRLDDILNTFAQDDRGPLRQRAGYANSMNASDNAISRQIRDYDRRIDTMQRWLGRRENHFFAMFARMEAAMAQSHAQMDALFAFAMQ